MPPCPFPRPYICSVIKAGFPHLQPAPADPTMLRAARLHYEQGMTHQEVADELGLSRVKVTRLIGEARRLGIVTIIVRDESRPYPELEHQLASRLGLVDVRVAPAFPGEHRSTAVALEAGRYLAAELPAMRRVAIGVSTTVADAVTHLPKASAADTVVIPMAGGWAGPSRSLNPDNLANQAALALGARACSMPAPLVAGSADMAAALIASPGVDAVLTLARASDALVVGIGVAPGNKGWDAALLGQALTAAEREELVTAGAVGDVSGRFFDATGRRIPSGLDQRIIGLSLAEMRAIPTRIALAFGRHKVGALRAAIVGGIISALVTDRVTAEALLRSVEGEAV